jgi:ribosomal protein S18 acetylase RimI-like enzyme
MKKIRQAPENWTIRLMTPADYPRVRALWESDSGIAISSVDEAEPVTRLLQRCPGISLVAEHGEEMIGGVLGSEDTRRGYVHHLIVAPAWRGRGLGRRLMSAIEQNFLHAGIPKAHLFVLTENAQVISFYESIKWFRRPDLVLMSRNLSS